MKKGYKSLITILSMLFLFSSLSFAQVLWEDNFSDTATDPGCLMDVGWMYYDESDGLAGAIVQQTAGETAFLQTGNFSSFVGAVVMQSNGCPEIDTADSDRGHDLLVDSSKGAPNSEILFNAGTADEKSISYSPPAPGGGRLESGLEVIQIDLLQGDDTINIESTPSESTVTINGGLGSDVFKVGVNASTGAEQNLNLIDGTE